MNKWQVTSTPPGSTMIHLDMIAPTFLTHDGPGFCFARSFRLVPPRYTTCIRAWLYSNWGSPQRALLLIWWRLSHLPEPTDCWSGSSDLTRVAMEVNGIKWKRLVTRHRRYWLVSTCSTIHRDTRTYTTICCDIPLDPCTSFVCTSSSRTDLLVHGVFLRIDIESFRSTLRAFAFYSLRTLLPLRDLHTFD